METANEGGYTASLLLQISFTDEGIKKIEGGDK